MTSQMSGSPMVTAVTANRRQALRIAALLGGGLAALPDFGFAAETSHNELTKPSASVRINGNEYWKGPVESGVQAAQSSIAHCNFYTPGNERADLIRAVSAMEQVPEDHIAPWAGSANPLARAVLAFCSPQRGLVTADPTFEVAAQVASWLKAPITRVPLRADYAHDVRAMVAANPQAGLFYVCNPNNPTGSITSREDIQWLLDNKPKGSAVLLDEAYIHFSELASGLQFVRDGRDIIVLRTFSKIYGMAGLRLGLSIARPDLINQLMEYDGRIQTQQLHVPAVHCAISSLADKPGIDARRADIAKSREKTVRFLRSHGYESAPSQANMILVDWKRPATPVRQYFEAHDVAIGRSWAIWPNRSRITIGSPENMDLFCRLVSEFSA